MLNPCLVAHRERMGGELGDGVTFTFANGARLSIQSSLVHHCTPGASVELHAWGPNNERINLQGRREVVGWVKVDDLPKFINKVKRWKPKEVRSGT